MSVTSWTHPTFFFLSLLRGKLNAKVFCRSQRLHVSLAQTAPDRHILKLHVFEVAAMPDIPGYEGCIERTAPDWTFQLDSTLFVLLSPQGGEVGHLARSPQPPPCSLWVFFITLCNNDIMYVFQQLTCHSITSYFLYKMRAKWSTEPNKALS